MTSTSRARFVVNGEEAAVRSDHPHLLAALREELGVTSPKDGCSPSGQCGACTVLLDGKPIQSCLVSLDRACGKTVTTLDGLDPADRDRMAAAFAATGALQCGFCTPGILVRVKALLDREGDSLTRETVAARLGGHLCRCTGYVKIFEAIDMLKAGESPRSSPGPWPGAGVGDRRIRYEAESLALGDRGYVDDMRPPGLVHAALRLADHARAEVVRIDSSRALACDDVIAVYTAADVPGKLRVGIIEEDWPVLIGVGGRTSYLGDALAVVVAETAQGARRAAELVDVEYEPLRPFADVESALASGEDSEDVVWGLEGAVLSTSAYARGDAGAALAEAAHIVEETFHTQRVEHAFLEPESTLAVPDGDGGLTVCSGGQGAWDDRRQIAAVLGLPTDRVIVEMVANGGAFGGKEDMSNQAQTALAAHLLGRPVKCTLTREQSFLMHPKRHPMRVEIAAGCDEEGLLTALRARIVADSGPYASVGAKVLERAAGHVCGPYAVPNIDVEAVAVRTNNPVCGAFRGFGANQAQFATEGVMDRLAEKAGLNGWEMRSRNVISPGDAWGPGQVMDEGAAGARMCLDAAKTAYDAAREAGKAAGLGLALKNSGLGNGTVEVGKAVVRFESDGSIEVRHCWTEMGQGVNTVAVQVAAEELAVDSERIRVIVDTTRELGAGQTTGSRGTMMGAGAVADACRAADEGGRVPGVDYEGRFTVDWTHSFDDPAVESPVIHSAFGYAAQVVVADPKTGEVEKVVAVHDVGKAVNPTLCEGQVEGAVHMGLGYALTEDFPTDDECRPKKTTLRSLGILRAKDVPEIEVVLLEAPQPRSPYGVKGVGEIGLVPTAGAVAAALHEVDGRRRNRLPMSRAIEAERRR